LQVERAGSYRAAGNLRCGTCNSTAYHEVRLIRGPDGPALYEVTTICWLGAHVLASRIMHGSPVRGRFPVSEASSVRTKIEASKRRASKRPKLVTMVSESARTLKTTYIGRRPVSMRRVLEVHEGAERVAGCDERCRLWRFIDPEDVDGPVYTKVDHSPFAHNEYGADEAQDQIYSWPDMEIDLDQLTIKVDGISLTAENRRAPTPKEWDIIKALVRNNGRLVTTSKLLTLAWGPTYTSEAHLLRVNMARLRSKLDPNSTDRFIRTRAGIGYVIVRARHQPEQKHHLATVAK
jgi:DNA-binding response OmpR family regulator